jgi:hypothetical protein
MWRQFAGLCVKQCKKPTNDGYIKIAEYLKDISDLESLFFKKLL